ncbi:ATP-dependent DNA helicase PIF1-like protein [Tanacetum coccineum]
MLSKGNNNVVVSKSARISLTPRPRGRPCITEISTRSHTFKSIIVNGTYPDKAVGDTTTKGKCIREKHASRFMNQTPVNFNIDYINHGDPTFECSSCDALLWYTESMRGTSNACSDSYLLCCGRGKVLLMNEVAEPPPLLKELSTNKHPKSASFIDNIRRYNSMFAFTSMGGKQDTSINMGQGPYCYRLHGENYHLAGPLLLETGKPAKFSQLYIFNTENEVQNRIGAVSNGESSSSKNNKLYYKLTTEIRNLLDEINLLVQDFRMAQFIIDAYTMIESERLTFNRKNDKDLRSETYSKLATLAQNSDFGVKLRGKKVVLNSSFTGSPRYMMENYLDVMAFCKFYGYPNLFISFTCNLNWPEISRFMEKRGLKSEDRPDVISEVFKIKLDCLMKELKDDHTFGHVQGDEYISAEIPNKDEDPELYQIVTDHMMHGPYGAENPSCPCTVDFKCTKKFPKQFNKKTVIGDSGYAIYKRRNDSSTIKKSGIDLHNGYVEPYNPRLLRRYQAHINVEYYNQVGSIKYLFKYINKGPDRVSATIDDEEVDEIKDYLNCRYFLAYEAAWRINGFDIYYRAPSVERLPFHLKDEQQDGKEYIDGLLEARFWGMGDYLCSIFVMLIMTDSMSRLMYDETSYNKDKLRGQHVKLYGSLTFEQKGYGGTGKTYLYKTMLAALRSKGEIVLNVASRGIAALLIEGGRTTHSRFAIPINVVKDLMCHIGADSDLADLIRKAKLIIWDEEPMINRHCYEAFDMTLRDICRTTPSVASNKVFRGKVVMFGGDFRQILPVITDDGRYDIVNATINASYLWDKCIVFRLTVNMSGANDGASTVVFPDNMLIPETDDDVGAIIDDTFPDLLQNLWNPSFFQEKAILAPTHEWLGCRETPSGCCMTFSKREKTGKLEETPGKRPQEKGKHF